MTVHPLHCECGDGSGYSEEVVGQRPDGMLETAMIPCPVHWRPWISPHRFGKTFPPASPRDEEQRRAA